MTYKLAPSTMIAGAGFSLMAWELACIRANRVSPLPSEATTLEWAEKYPRSPAAFYHRILHRAWKLWGISEYNRDPTKTVPL